MSTDQRINDSAFREWMSDVPCSVCGAGVGDGCKGGTGQIHLARALAAQEVAAKSDDHLRHGPWRWDDNRPEAGLWCEIGHPLICEYNLDTWEIEPVVDAATSAAPELMRALRKSADLVRWLAPFAFAYASEHPESNMPTKVDVDDTYRSAMELLARIDAARS